jgi:hypothetical protein
LPPSLGMIPQTELMKLNQGVFTRDSSVAVVVYDVSSNDLSS